jgi:Flp pilus assembly protein TadG
VSRLKTDYGYTALLTALALLFLLGAAALAVDTSMFFQQARSEQRVADLACLAGAQELPETPAAAVEMAASFLRPNHPDLAGLDPSVTETGSGPVPGLNRYLSGSFTVEIETPFNGQATEMRVSVNQDRGTHFAKAIGATTVPIQQDAFCEVGSAIGGAADMPFGVLSGFTGGIINYDNNGCTLNGQTNSQCSGLAIPRHDDPSGSGFHVNTADNYRANIISGINWQLFPPNSTFPSSQDILCRSNQAAQPGDPEPCNRVATVSGSDPSKVYDGLISGNNKYPPESQVGYLEKHHLVFESSHGDPYDSHTLEDVATCVDGHNSSTVIPCPSPESSLTWTGPNDAPTVYISKVEDCDCPRFSRIPVVDPVPGFPEANCTVHDPNDITQINKCFARIVGFSSIFLLRPYFNGEEPPDGPGPVGNPANDFHSNGQQVKFLAAVNIVFNDNVQVEGRCFSGFKQGFPKAVRLINN